MNKKEFIEQLDHKLSILNVKDKNEVVSYYDELISDQLETGKSEEEVIKKLGSISDIVIEALVTNDELSKNEDAMKKVVKKIKTTSREMPRWSFIVIVATAIIWIPIVFGLLIGLLSAGIGIIAGGFAILLTLMIVPVALTLGFALGGAFVAIISILHLIIYTNVALGFFYLGMGVILLGLSIIIYPITISFIKWTFSTFRKVVNTIYVKYRVWRARKGVIVREN